MKDTHQPPEIQELKTHIYLNHKKNQIKLTENDKEKTRSKLGKINLNNIKSN